MLHIAFDRGHLAHSVARSKWTPPKCDVSYVCQITNIISIVLITPTPLSHNYYNLDRNPVKVDIYQSCADMKFLPDTDIRYL